MFTLIIILSAAIAMLVVIEAAILRRKVEASESRVMTRFNALEGVVYEIANHTAPTNVVPLQKRKPVTQQQLDDALNPYTNWPEFRIH